MDPHGFSPLSVLYLFRVPVFFVLFYLYFFKKKLCNKFYYGFNTCVPPVLNLTVFGEGALEGN